MPERVAVLLACHNRREKTLDCLTHLYRQQMPNNYLLEVYLVNGGCGQRVLPGSDDHRRNRGAFLEPRNVYCVE